MAKRKTPKKEKILDFKPRPEKINQQHLAKLQSHIRTMDQLIMQIGHAELQKHHTLKGMEGIQKTIEELRVQFKKEYGTDNINIDDGTIAYPPENLNPEENGETNKED